MIELTDDALRFSFPEVYPGAACTIDFQRTLRIPDDNRSYPLPAGLGRFPLFHVDDFAGLGVPAPIVHVLADRDITAPFPIQQLVLPDALAGRDICGRAPTGSGKTLAFGLPVVSRVGRARVVSAKNSSASKDSRNTVGT